MRFKSFIAVAILLICSAGLLFAGGAQQGPATAGAPAKVTLFVPGNAPEDMAKVHAALREYTVPKINAELEINWVGWGEWYDRMSLMVASGEEFDIGFTATWSMYADQVARNAWLPLNDLIENHAPELNVIVGHFLKGPVRNGNIYAIPTVKEIGGGDQWLVNARFAEKYDIPVQELRTVEDIEHWMAIIRPQEPREIAMFHAQPGTMGPHRFNISYVETVYHPLFNLEADGKIRFAFLTDSYWDDMAKLREWNKQGYLYPNQEEIVLQGNFNDIRQFGNWVFMHHVAHPGKAGELSAELGFEVIGSGPTQSPVVMNSMLLGSMLGISRTSPNPEAAIKMIALMNSDEYVNNLINFGIEGTHYSFVDQENGIIRQIPDSGYAPGMNWVMQNQFINYLRENEDPEKWNKYIEFNDSAVLGKAVGFFPDITPVRNEVAAVQVVFDQYFRMLESGIQDMTPELRRRVASEFEVAGVARIEQELQRQYEEWLRSR